MFIFSEKNCGVGRALNRRATRAAHFNGVVQLARRRPIQGCLGIARNMGNRGADAPTGTSEPIRLGRSVHTSMTSI